MWPFSKAEKTVLMVCTANVCRSPAAEALLKHRLKQGGLARRVKVISAGTDVAAPGRKPDPRVVAILNEMGVSTRGIRAAPLTPEAVGAASQIFVMEASHRDALLQRFPESAERVLLLDPGDNDIADPYFGNKAGVRAAVEQIGEFTAELSRALAEDLGRDD